LPYCLPVERQYNPNNPPASPRTHVQETVFPYAATATRVYQSHLSIKRVQRAGEIRNGHPQTNRHTHTHRQTGAPSHCLAAHQ
jgi:hypothetical protein